MSDATFTMDLDFEERKDVKGYKTFELASAIITNTISRGSSTTQYALQPAKWLKQAMEYAKDNMVMQPLTKQETLENGVAQLSIPLEAARFANWETSAEEYSTANTDILFTDIDNLDGVIFDPVNENYGVAVTNKALRRNALNLMENYQKQLADHLSYQVDAAIYTGIRPLSGFAGVEMTNSVRGIQTIFGGDATNADNTLEAGDVMTPALIKKANRLLKSTKGGYWNSNVFTTSAIATNPWPNDSQGPFYGIINPESEEALLGSSQFTSAAELGADSVIKTGKIGKYMGINMHSTTMLADYAASANVYVQAANCSMGVAGGENYFLVANKFAGLVWGQKPKFYAFDYPSQLQKRLVVEMAYHTKPLYNDGIVRVITADE